MKKIVVLLISIIIFANCDDKNSNSPLNEDSNTLGLTISSEFSIYIKNSKGDDLIGTPGYETFHIYYYRNGEKVVQYSKQPPYSPPYSIYKVDNFNVISIILDLPKDDHSMTRTVFEYNGKETVFSATAVTGKGYWIIKKVYRDGVEIWDGGARITTIIDPR